MAWSPEEVAEFRARLGIGSPDVGKADQVVSRTSESLGHVANHPLVRVAPGVASPISGPIQMAVDHVAAGNPVADLATKTRAEVGDTAVGLPTMIRPMEPPAPDVGPAPQEAPSPMQQAASMRSGGGAPGGSGLRAQWLAARDRVVGDMDRDKDLALQLGVDRAGKVEGVGMLVDELAARQQREAAIQREEDERAAIRLREHMMRTQELVDDVGKQKTDFKSMFRNASTADKAIWFVGSILGGARAGLQGGANQFLAAVDKQIDREIADQQSEIESKRAAVDGRKSVFQQMLAEVGDARLAAMQTRNLMYEALKMKLGADAERLGIPEIRTNAEMAAQAVQEKQDALQEAFAREAYEQAMRAAAAAAASRKAAEREAWERSLKVAELGLKRDELEIKKLEAGKGVNDDIQKQVQALGKDLGDEKLAAGRAPIEALKRAAAGTPEGQSIPGLSRLDDARAQLGPNTLAGKIPAVMLADKLVGLSDQERVNRGNWKRMQLAYQTQITGSGGSDEQMAAIKAAFEGARTPAEQRAAIDTAESIVRQVEARRKAAYDPRAVQIYEGRLNANPGAPLPDSVRIKK